MTMNFHLHLDPEQLRLYGGHLDCTRITLRTATEPEASSLSPTTPDSVILYKAYLESGLRIPLTPLVRGILAWFDIAPCQVNPNFYRAISVAAAAIPYLGPGLALTPELFVNCYNLGFYTRSGNGAPLGLFVISRHLDVAVPGWTLGGSEERWMNHPFVVTGQGWQGSEKGLHISCVPNQFVDLAKPPPTLSGKDATAFDLLRRGRNAAFDKFLKTSHQTGTLENAAVSSSSSQHSSFKRMKLSWPSSDQEAPTTTEVEPTISRSSSKQVISQHEKKGKENKFKAKAQTTNATNIIPLDASSTPKTPSSTTILTVDAGLTKREIAQRTRRAREKQSNTFYHKGKAILSPNFPLTSTKETACPVSPNTQTMGSANRSEDFEPSPAPPPECPTQFSESQSRPQAVTDTIPPFLSI